MWRGYKHTWTYNHRINRIGSYIDSKSGESVYASASGMGADSTYYLNGSTFLESEHLDFVEGKVQFKLTGKEKDLINVSEEIIVPMTEEVFLENNFGAVLNGFDLKAEEKADKLTYINLELEKLRYEKGALRFNTKVGFVASCRSLECERLKQLVDYTIDVYYLLISSQPKYLTTQEHSFSKDYSWDKKEEIYKAPELVEIKSNAQQAYEHVAIGIKAISIQFDHEHWLKEWSNFVEVLEYDTDKGIAQLSLDFYYKDWAEKMGKNSAYPKHGKFSMKAKGWVNLRLQLLMFQFNETEVIHKNTAGSLFWMGKNKSPDGADAVDRKKIGYPITKE